MNTNNTDINVKNLCSRKLWQLLNDKTIASPQLDACEMELLTRQHYLYEMRNLRKQNKNTTQH